MRTVRIKVYKFPELSAEAQAKAIEQFRYTNVEFWEWWEGEYESFSDLCKTIGIDVDLKQTYFSGFPSQGSGACFTADVNISALIKGIAEQSYTMEFPKTKIDVTACTVDRRILSLIESGEIDFSCVFEANERYKKTKANCNWYLTDREIIDSHQYQLEEWLQNVADKLTHLLYKSLEKEYDYQTSDGAVKDSIISNEYEFTRDGKQF